jgi:hypothetical protein
MTPEERQDKIELYGRGHELLKQALAELPKEMWQFRPAPQEWSIHEIIVHLADSEINAAMRARLLIAQPGGTLMGYDQDVWADKLYYHEQSTADALEMVRLARATTYKLLRSLPEETWQHTANHPEYERPYSFEKWLDTYAGHIPNHIDQMRENHRIWQEGQKK